MSLNGVVWAPIGPSPISQGPNEVNGLVTAIAVRPGNPNIIYIGTAGGGVWRTDDGGTTWFSLFDRQLSLAVGEPGGLAIDPNDADVIYVGTSGRVAAHPQAGLFRSTDGGASWILLGSGYPAGNVGNASQFPNHLINVVIVDPANSNTLYLSSHVGCYRSTDGGLNWTQGVNSGGDARSLVLDTSSPPASRILYAGINGRGVFRSNDGGQNWTQILSGATPVVAAAVGPAPAGFRKCIVAIAPPTAPPNPAGVQVLYLTLEGTGGAPDPVGVFMSTDQGATWTQQTGTGMPTRTQGGYSFHMAVDPASPGDGANDIIYLGAVGHGRSGDSGNNFTGLVNVHADNHSWAFVQQPSPTPSIVYCGNDGGLYRSIDDGVTWTALGGGGLQTGLFYNLDIRPDATASNSVGALQDNGTQTRMGGAGQGWVAGQGGDGWDVVYDATTASQVYCTSGFWSPAPCTRIWRSADDAQTFSTEITPWGVASDAGCYLGPLAADPTTGGILYASGSQNLWQTQDAGANWRILSAFGGTGDVDVARTNSNNVVIAVGNQVFVTTNALAATVGPPAGVTFTNITRNLPPRTVTRVAFDPNDATRIYVVLGGLNGGPGNVGHVFRTTITGTAWTDISPDLDVPFNAIALDGTDNPTGIYAGTDFGVLCSVDGGLSWSVLDDIHFPRVPVFDLAFRNGVLRAATYGRGAFEFIHPQWPAIAVNLENNLAFGNVCQGPRYLALEIYNVGKSDLIIHSVQRLMGSTSFSVLPTPGVPLVITAGDHVNFTIEYNPVGAPGPETATIRIVSNDPNAPQVDLSATGVRAVARLITAVADAGSFGNVCVGKFTDRDLIISNGGECALTIIGLTSSSGDFLLPSVVAFPVVVAPGSCIALPIRFQPNSFGAKAANITIFSNAAAPRVIGVSGNAPPPAMDTLIADAGHFGQVCAGNFVDRYLTVNNSGACALEIISATSSSAEFLVPSVTSYPVIVGSGDSLALPVRFQPASFGFKTGTITLLSNDPAGPGVVSISGVCPPPELDLIIANNGYFGKVCIGGVVDKPLTLLNSGPCTLTVTNITSSASEFIVPNVISYPIRIAPGTAVEMPIRFAPGSFGTKSAIITVHSDDPTGPKTVTVSGEVPSGKLAVTGSTCIGGVKACCVGERTIAICNVGDCKLHVTSVAFKRKSKHWKLINNPFPATLHSGSCLQVLIRYKATEKCPRCCELVITSDDPVTPVKVLDVMAYTVWDRCGCSKCCEDCSKGCCDKTHTPSCCTPQSLDACCEDEGDGHEHEDES